MKKLSKLQLRRETLRLLTDLALVRGVVGGATGFSACGVNCAPPPPDSTETCVGIRR